MSSIGRRKRYFIKPGFQSRLTAIFILIVIIVANIVGALVYGFSIEKLENKLVVESKLPIDTSLLGQALLPGVVIAELISILIVCFICIFVTHTIAGPVYRMERVSKSIGTGDLTNFIKLRPKDELKDLADSMNEMTMGLRNKVLLIRENSDKLKAILDRAKSSGKIDKIDELNEICSSLSTNVAVFVLEKEPPKGVVAPADAQPTDQTPGGNA
ncbi:MAG: methyl-accepting chemotaxis protein [Candidatus Riflebacteria bacterium]|nr:methyl-accepting chemotaxis protein [Candidatus Riflebacteria bacterium]